MCLCVCSLCIVTSIETVFNVGSVGVCVIVCVCAYVCMCLCVCSLCIVTSIETVYNVWSVGKCAWLYVCAFTI